MDSSVVPPLLQSLHDIVLGEVECNKTILNQLMELIKPLLTYRGRERERERRSKRRVGGEMECDMETGRREG